MTRTGADKEIRKGDPVEPIPRAPEEPPVKSEPIPQPQPREPIPA